MGVAEKVGRFESLPTAFAVVPNHLIVPNFIKIYFEKCEVVRKNTWTNI